MNIGQVARIKNEWITFETNFTDLINDWLPAIIESNQTIKMFQVSLLAYLQIQKFNKIQVCVFFRQWRIARCRVAIAKEYDFHKMLQFH